MTKIFALFLLTALSASAIQAVDFVDVDRYMGRWYLQSRIARPLVEPPGCDCAQQTLSRNSAGHFDVYNSCHFFSPNGPRVTQRAKAYPDDPHSNSRMTVDFGDDDPGKYWIIAIDPDYEWSVVTDPEKNRLFIMSRVQVLSEDKYQTAVEAASLQLPTHKLKRTNHIGCRYP